MPAVSSDDSSVEQQAFNALHHLDAADKAKVLEYIDNLLTLEKANHHDQGSN